MAAEQAPGSPSPRPSPARGEGERQVQLNNYLRAVVSTTPVGILLAAGRGRRFDPGGRRDKLLALLPSGLSVAVAAANNLRAALPRVVAVVRPDADALASALRNTGCEVVVCPHADEGMGTVLAYAVQHCADAGAWVVALADMPFIAAETYAAVVTALAKSDLVAAEFSGQRGHPVGIGRRFLAQLLSLKGDLGARQLFANTTACLVRVNDRGTLRDIDTIADL